ncbi:MAG: metallophosphoesterase [Pirellulales bacterium]|nr:metallophosphoesterase [Pirellulales bacterium]
MKRRRFLKLAGGSTLVAGAALFGYTWRIEPHWIEVVRRKLPIAGLPDSLLGRTLVQISDLHVGPIVDEDYIIGAVEQVSSLDADLLVLSGDLITYRGPRQIDQTVRVLGRLQPGRLATLAVLGNHDYGHGWSQAGVADELAGRLEALGMTILRNRLQDVQGLQVLGMDDLWAGRFEAETVLGQLDRQRAAIAVCHNPDAVDRPEWSGYRGWILSGHTHGGQCKPPWLAPPRLPVRNKRYSAGEIDLYDGRRLYINRGLGYVRRVRFNARPEITVFTLTRPA